MTNSEVALALQRWSFDPKFGEHAQTALTRAARRILMTEWSVAERAEAGTLTELPRVGPFVARVIRELLSGSRPADPPVADWPPEVRAAYDAGDLGRRHLIALRDARRLVDGRGYPRPGGDLQLHTTWSDGAESPAVMATVAANLGYRFIAITDHTRGAPFARGMKAEALALQRSAIAALNEHSPVRVFAGAETNILPTGALDVEAAELVGTDFVLASPHSALRRREDQTARLLAVVSHPAVHALGHGRGRIFGTPRGIEARWDEVFAAAAEHGTAIEINAYPDRQDLDHTLVARAAAAGCLLSLGTDSHDPEEMAFMDIAVAHLVQAAVPADRVLNYWELPALEAWLVRKRVRGPAAVAPASMTLWNS